MPAMVAVLHWPFEDHVHELVAARVMVLGCNVIEVAVNPPVMFNTTPLRL